MAVCEELMKIRKEHSNEHWSLSQIRIKCNVEIQKMTITQASNRLNEIFADCNGLRPVIFFDESEKFGSNREFALKLKCIRRVVRKLQFIPIFMGTNASLVKFVNTNIAAGSRGGETAPWYYVLYKLAPTSEQYIRNEIDNITRLVKEKFSKHDEIVEFLKLIALLLKNERPFVCQLVLTRITKNIDQIHWSVWFENLKFIEIFEDIVHNVFEQFTRRKNMLLNRTGKNLFD